MAALPGKRTFFIGTVVVIVAIGLAAVFAPSYVVRRELVNYLKSQGLTSVRIKDVDANIFTGHVAITNAVGKNAEGGGFSIGHLALDLAYPPLLHHRIVLDSLAIRGARVDVTRTADNHFRIAGIPLSQKGKSQSTSSDWRYGLKKLTLGALALHYHQAAGKDHKAIDRVITLNDSRAADIVTWQSGQSMPVDAHIGVDGGSIRISGHVTPFGPTRHAALHIVTHGFPLALIAPLARRAGMARVKGKIDTDQQITLTEAKNKPLKAQSTGRIAFDDLSITRSGNRQAKAGQIAWKGKAQLTLWRPDGAPGKIQMQGQFGVKKLVMHRGDTFSLSADQAHWQGKGETILDHPLRISTRGSYDDDNVHLKADDALDLATASEKLSGYIETTLGDKRITVATNGHYAADKLSFSVPKSLSAKSDRLNWNGTTQTTVADQHTRIDTDGHLDGQALAVTVPNTAQFTTQKLIWKGQTHVDKGQLLAQNAEGHLTTLSPRLELSAEPILFKADNFNFDGQYARQPTDDNAHLKLMLSGEANSANLAAMDTKLDAPWVSALQSRASDIKIDGLSDITLGELKTSGLRLLGDTNSNVSVLQAVSLDAKQFQLTGFSHYALDSLTIGDAIIHVRRDKSGMGVISQYFGSKKSASGQKNNTASKNESKNTYQVSHFEISGPAVYFTDTTTDPAVNLHGHKLDLTVNGLDTGHPDKNAQYNLALNLGAYGHFNSKGTIAPLAPNGVDMNVRAWLRSLSLPPLSGYLNAAMGRKIARGVINGTVNLKSTNGKLNGQLSASIANFRLANVDDKTTEIAMGINMETALALIRGQDDEFHFQTKILGNVTNPYFSIDNLIREAVLAGLRTALLSNYSPIGLAAKLKNVFLDFFRSVAGHPATFPLGKHYIQPSDRHYLEEIARAMVKHPTWQLALQGHATLADAKEMALEDDDTGPDSEAHQALAQLAKLRMGAVRDYLAARGVNTANLILQDPVVSTSGKDQPVVQFSLSKKSDQ